MTARPDVPLTDHAFEQRKSTLVAKLDVIGEVTAADTGRPARERRILLAVHAPGGGLPLRATFEYTETFRRDPRGRWLVTQFRYEYRPMPSPSRLAYHWHDPWSYHAHCLDPRQLLRAEHYRSHAVDILWAHDRFYRLYVRDEPVACDDLHPL